MLSPCGILHNRAGQMSESNRDTPSDLRSTSSAENRRSRGAIVAFVGDYRYKTRQFSRNANLYVIHGFGMDMNR